MDLIISIAMKYSVVTTFNQAGYNLYGQRMIKTFLQTWPNTVDLVVYAEDCVVQETADNLKVLDLCESSPALVTFKQRWSRVPYATGDVSGDPVRSKRSDSGKGFKWDAVRFSHKVYAIFHCAQNFNTDWLLWMDADTVCHSAISEAVLHELCPDTAELCFLGRRNKFSECGLYAMRITSPAVKNFLADFQNFYDNAESGIFTLAEWHDSFVFDAVRARHSLAQVDWSGHLVTGEGHPLINSAWGAYLDHLKGKRKTTGRSMHKDLFVKRSEAYWK
jgi:hypothetical protein